MAVPLALGIVAIVILAGGLFAVFDQVGSSVTSRAAAPATSRESAEMQERLGQAAARGTQAAAERAMTEIADTIVVRGLRDDRFPALLPEDLSDLVPGRDLRAALVLLEGEKVSSYDRQVDRSHGLEKFVVVGIPKGGGQPIRREGTMRLSPNALGGPEPSPAAAPEAEPAPVPPSAGDPAP